MAEEKPSLKMFDEWKEKLRRYKIPLSITAAIVVVAVSAAAHYKNERVKEELSKAIERYQKNLLQIGGELSYESLECSGLFSTECEIGGIKGSVLGEEQFSIQSLRLGKVEEFEKLQSFIKGGDAKAKIDISVEQIALPKPILAQIVQENVAGPFQHDTLEKLSTLDLALEGEIEGSKGVIESLELERLKIDNAIMPIEFSMKARNIAMGMPDAMILDRFALKVHNKAIADVTYESVKSFAATLQPEDKAIFLKEFGLQPSDLDNKEKASRAINAGIARQFENDLKSAHGAVEKELIGAIASLLKGETDEIELSGENKKGLSMVQLQNTLMQSSIMDDERSKQFLEEQFEVKIKTD